MEIKKLQSKELPEAWEDVESILYHQGFPYILEIIWSKLISRYYNDLLASYFGNDKTCKLIIKKYYYPTLCQNVKVYVKRYNVYLVLKTIEHKSYGELQSLPISIHY